MCFILLLLSIECTLSNVPRCCLTYTVLVRRQTYRIKTKSFYSGEHVLADMHAISFTEVMMHYDQGMQSLCVR